MLGAYFGSVIGEWALWVAILVYAYGAGGSKLAGITSAGLLIPASVVAPFAGRAADGARPDRVLFLVYVAQTASLASAALLAMAGAPPWAVIVAVGVAVTGVTFIRPSIAVVVPGLVVSPGDLVAANLLTGNADSFSVLAGPLLASALLVADGPALVFAACAAVNAVGVLLTFRLGDRSGVGPGAVASTRVTHARRSRLMDAMRTMAQQRGTLPLLAVLGGQYALVGALDLLVVDLAFTVLGLGDAGPGVLSALVGVGAVLGGAASVVIVGRRQLSIVMIACLGAIAAAMATLGASPVLWTTALMLPVAGTGRSLLDVSGRMLLQRCAPQDALASVFAILEVLSGAGMLCGSVMVQVLIAHGGSRAALFGVAIFFVLVIAVTAPGLRRVEEHADAPVVQIRLLRATRLFGALPGPVLESLARGSEMIDFGSSTTIVRQGEPGDDYFVIAGGMVDVHVDGVRVRSIGRPAGFGEIALLADLPRTATVTTAEPTSVLAIERSQFLAAVTGHDESARVAWALARELHPTLSEQFDG
ncbi:MAG TPA: cyclic nucleotide-binding domain-containing protein [Ilumatobacteraceae bacterium]|nr:cyclic nucleotide-binding domain-containing protein [Ilumatobacteraceae bacterium]